MAGTLPSWPDHNPFSAYLAAFDTIFNRPHREGFGVRLAVLAALCLVGIVTSVASLILLACEGTRRKERVWWLFRLVPKGNRSYVVINIKLVSPIMAITALSVQLAVLHTSYSIYLRKHSQSSVAVWLTLPAFILVMHGWVASWGVFQGYFSVLPDEATSDKRDANDVMSPRLANSLFFAGGFLGGAGLLICGAIFGIRAQNLEVQLKALVEIFKTNEVAWSGATPTIASLLVLAGPLRTLSIHYGVFKNAGVAAWTMTGSLALAIVMVNCTSLALALALHREAASKLGLSQKSIRPAVSKGAFTSQSFLSFGGIISRRSRAPTQVPIERDNAECEREVVVLSPAALKAVGYLVAAERDLLWLSGAIIAVSSACLVISILFTHSLATSTVSTPSLPRSVFELCIFGIVWIYACTVSISSVLFIHRQLRQLPFRQPPPVFFVGNTSLVFGGDLAIADLETATKADSLESEIVLDVPFLVYSGAENELSDSVRREIDNKY